MMTRNRFFVFITGAILLSGSAQATLTGLVTPTAVTYTMTSASLLTTDNKEKTLLSGSYPITFKRADANFTAVSLSSVTMPQGRYIGVKFCLNNERSVLLDGVLYQGTTTGGVTDNSSTLYTITTGSTATTAGSISTTAPVGGATMESGYTAGFGTSNCSSSYFVNTVCVSAAAAGCVAGDTVVDPKTQVPDLNFVLDMYHLVGIDAGTMTLVPDVASATPQASIGKPGAAVHMASITSGSYADVVYLFDNNKKLLYSSVWGAGPPVAGACGGGVAVVTLTAAPAGSLISPNGTGWVQSVNLTTGLAQAAVGTCASASSCSSGGIMTITNFNQAAGATTTGSCVADSAAVPPYLGFTYTGGPGGTGSATYTVARVIDPSGLFGNCTASSATLISGSTGSCAVTTGTQADGYP